MSHLRPEERRGRHSRASCRRGRHLWGEARNIGAGILRQVCETCGEVSIDLTHVEDPATTIRARARWRSSAG